jgi:hypothetical protein
MRQPGQLTFPVFEFRRESGNEIGRLYFNSFGQRPKMRARREIASVIAYLQAEIQAGRLPDVAVGWPGSGLKPTNAVDVRNDAVMAPWRARAFVVAVRVTRRDECATSAESKRILGYEEAPT